MKRKSIIILAFAALAITASGTHGATSIALERTANVDIVDQNAGLLAVSQTTTNFNTTLNTADLRVDVTNQFTADIDQVNITVDGVTKTTGTVSPGVTYIVSFTDVDCASTVVIQYSTGSLEQRITADIRCT
jgi:ABC-type glycerol-3-phosphate transport system substrate-binding protein